MLVNPQGGNGITTIAYTTTLPLDYTAGKDMGSHTVSTAEVWIVGAGAIQNGALQVILVGGGGSLSVPSDWTFFPGSSAPVLTSGTRNFVAIFYIGNSVLWSVTPMSALDVVAPTLVSAIVSDTDASRIDLVWSEGISAAVSAPAAFAVSAGHPLTIHAYVDPTHTYLITSSSFVQGETKTLAYAQPSLNKMQDLAGNLLANFSGTAITDNLTLPTLVSATVPDSDPLRINLVWSKPMNSAVSAAAAFAVSSVHSVTNHTYDTATTSHLTTTVAFITGESAKTLAYTQPGSNKMQDLAGGNLVANFSGTAITNSVSSPTLVSAVVANSTPTKIDLTWSEAMNTTVLASAANFAVSSGHALTGHVNIDATHSQLTTSTAFIASETKTLAYTASGTSDMKDAAGGNLVQNFSGTAITDNVGATGFSDNFSGTYPTRSDGGSWTLLTGTAPVNSAGKLTPGAAGGDIAADLGHQNTTVSVDVTTTTGTFTPILRLASDGSATTNYIGVAIDNTGAAFGVMVYAHDGGVFTSLSTSTGAVFTSGVAGTISIVVTGAPGTPTWNVKFNGTTIPAATSMGALNTVQMTSVYGHAGSTRHGIMVPSAGVTYDNYNAT